LRSAHRFSRRERGEEFAMSERVAESYDERPVGRLEPGPRVAVVVDVELDVRGQVVDDRRAKSGLRADDRALVALRVGEALLVEEVL
jgi:hypothetical protein